MQSLDTKKMDTVEHLPASKKEICLMHVSYIVAQSKFDRGLDKYPDSFMEALAGALYAGYDVIGKKSDPDFLFLKYQDGTFLRVRFPESMHDLQNALHFQRVTHDEVIDDDLEFSFKTYEDLVTENRAYVLAMHEVQITTEDFTETVNSFNFVIQKKQLEATPLKYKFTPEDFNKITALAAQIRNQAATFVERLMLSDKIDPSTVIRDDHFPVTPQQCASVHCQQCQTYWRGGKESNLCEEHNCFNCEIGKCVYAPPMGGPNRRLELAKWVKLDGSQLPDTWLPMVLYALAQVPKDIAGFERNIQSMSREVSPFNHFSSSDWVPTSTSPDSVGCSSKKADPQPAPLREEGGSNGGCSPSHVSLPIARPVEAPLPEQVTTVLAAKTRKSSRPGVKRLFLSRQQASDAGRVAAASVYSGDRATGKQVEDNTKQNEKPPADPTTPGRQKQKATVVFEDSADDKAPIRKGKRQREETDFYSNQQAKAILSEEKEKRATKRHCRTCLDVGHDSRNCPYNAGKKSPSLPPQQEETAPQAGQVGTACLQDLATAILSSADRGQAAARQPQSERGCSHCRKQGHYAKTCPKKK